MVDFLAFLDDSDYYIDDESGEFIITSPIVQTEEDFMIEIPIKISSKCNTIIKCKHFNVTSDIISFSSVTFEGSLIIRNSSNVTIQNCTIQNSNQENGVLLLLSQCENCLLSHITFISPNLPGLIIYNSVVTSDNLTFSNFSKAMLICKKSSFLTLKDSQFLKSESKARGITSYDQSSIEIFNSTFSEIAYTSIASIGSRSIIKDCTFQDIGAHSIFFERINDFTIENCHFFNTKNDSLRKCGSVYIGDNSCGSIIGCDFDNFDTNMINIVNNSDCLIKNNVFNNFHPQAICVKEKSVATIQNNKLTKSLRNAIAVRGAHHVEIENTKIEEVGETGISVSDTNLCLIHDNEISNCSIASIEIFNNSKVTAKNNQIRNIHKFAFHAFTCGQIKAEKNDIQDIGECMVKLTEKCSGEFIDNQISNCPKQFECDSNLSSFFFSGNGNFTSVTNDKTRTEKSIVFEEINKNDNSMCMRCHKNKRECFFDLCFHNIFCKECTEHLINEHQNCPLCRFEVKEAINGITIDDDKMCIICYDKKADCILNPCGHIVSCCECLENWMKTKKECPVCRKEISSFGKIYNFE